MPLLYFTVPVSRRRSLPVGRQTWLVTRLRLPDGLGETMPAGDYEVLYVLPAAGEIQIARTKLSLGQKDKPEWETLRRNPGVLIECVNCRDWFDTSEIPIDEVRGWRCVPCSGRVAA